MKYKKPSVSTRCLFFCKADKASSVQIYFFFLFSFFFALIVFFFKHFYFCTGAWMRPAILQEVCSTFGEVPLLSIESAARKPQPHIRTGSTLMGRHNRRRMKLKACAGWVRQQTNRAAGVSMTMSPVNCSWLEAYFTAWYQSLCILLTLFHCVEALQLYGAPNLHQLEINSCCAVNHSLTRVAGPSFYVQLLPLFPLPLPNQQVTLLGDE